MENISESEAGLVEEEKKEDNVENTDLWKEWIHTKVFKF